MWKYVVTNTGNTDISGITVSDDRGVVVTCPSDLLVAGATMDCEGKGPLTDDGDGS